MNNTIPRFDYTRIVVSLHLGSRSKTTIKTKQYAFGFSDGHFFLLLTHSLLLHLHPLGEAKWGYVPPLANIKPTKNYF